MKKRCWVSFDLGIKGDYEGLFIWLDSLGSRECGPNVATFEYEYQSDLIAEIKEDLQAGVDLSKNDRIYIIWRERDRMRGSFIYGQRKVPPWSGYGAQEPQVDEEEV